MKTRSRMWNITVRRTLDEIQVHIELDGHFYDEVGFHPSWIDEFREYLFEITSKIIHDVTRG